MQQERVTCSYPTNARKLRICEYSPKPPPAPRSIALSCSHRPLRATGCTSQATVSSPPLAGKRHFFPSSCIFRIGFARTSRGGLSACSGHCRDSERRLCLCGREHLLHEQPLLCRLEPACAERARGTTQRPHFRHRLRQGSFVKAPFRPAQHSGRLGARAVGGQRLACEGERRRHRRERVAPQPTVLRNEGTNASSPRSNLEARLQLRERGRVEGDLVEALTGLVKQRIVEARGHRREDITLLLERDV
mmetsp:Transcript_30096/g.63402  ORF Transcript_30096/g.63402 Transcript_30096/m.63402 type:complete len:248 (-) Transcript_30096:189-932(-)